MIIAAASLLSANWPAKRCLITVVRSARFASLMRRRRQRGSDEWSKRNGSAAQFLAIELEETAEAVLVKISPPRLDSAILDLLVDSFASVPPLPPTALPEREDKPTIRCVEIGLTRKHDL